MELGLGRLRWAAAILANVGADEITAGVRAEDGQVRKVGGPRPPSVCTATEFRLAVIEATDTGFFLPVQTLLEIGDARPVDIVLEGGASMTSFDGDNRWRRQCSCRTTDYLIMGPDLSQCVTIAAGALSEALADPWPHVRALGDTALGFTVVACDWPEGLSDLDRTRFEQGLRDLAVLGRVRANLEQAESPHYR